MFLGYEFGTNCCVIDVRINHKIFINHLVESYFDGKRLE